MFLFAGLLGEDLSLEVLDALQVGRHGFIPGKSAVRRRSARIITLVPDLHGCGSSLHRELLWQIVVYLSWKLQNFVSSTLRLGAFLEVGVVQGVARRENLVVLIELFLVSQIGFLSAESHLGIWFEAVVLPLVRRSFANSLHESVIRVDKILFSKAFQNQCFVIEQGGVVPSLGSRRVALQIRVEILLLVVKALFVGRKFGGLSLSSREIRDSSAGSLSKRQIRFVEASSGVE